MEGALSPCKPLHVSAKSKECGHVMNSGYVRKPSEYGRADDVANNENVLEVN
jgi:hypothetical protein